MTRKRCEDCESNPCICDRTRRTANAWLIRTCPTCQQVKIRERIGLQSTDACQWCQAKEMAATA